MRVAVMQPYFLPYGGYFELAARVDCFIFLDSVQYIRRGWVNRNRLPDLSPTGWHYIHVPTKYAPREEIIERMEVAEDPPWRPKLEAQLRQTYGRSPHFQSVLALLSPLLQGSESNLSSLLQGLVRDVSQYLGLSPRWERSSQLISERPELRSLRGKELILGLCEAVGGTQYWNLSGGRELYDENSFLQRGMELHFTRALSELPDGPIPRDALPWSILDSLMRFSPEQWRDTWVPKGNPC